MAGPRKRCELFEPLSAVASPLVHILLSTLSLPLVWQEYHCSMCNANFTTKCHPSRERREHCLKFHNLDWRDPANYSFTEVCTRQ
mgnify:CR=1 FL=1|jgi:hypothetical protein